MHPRHSRTRRSLAARTALLCTFLMLAARESPAEKTHESAGAGPGLAPLLGSRLRDTIAAVEREVDGVLGVVVLDLQTGQRIGCNQDAVFPTASAIKLPILIELFHQSQLAESGAVGPARLDAPYTPRAEDVIADSSILAGLSYGVSRLTSRDLATFMIVVSDNGATNLLIDRVGMAAVNQSLTRLGFVHTRLRRKMLDSAAVRRGLENTSTPAELAELWARLYRGQLLDAAHTAEALRVLSLPKDSYLAAGLPPESAGPAVRLASKAGSLDGARIDAGIIWAGRSPSPRPFVISVMVAYAHSDRAAEAAIARLAAAAYSYYERLADSTPYGRRLP